MTFVHPPLHPEPVDPHYVAFRDGFTAFILGKSTNSGLRWTPWIEGGSWRLFSINEYDYIDFGVFGPKSPLEATFGTDKGTGRYSLIWRWPGQGGDPNLPELSSAVFATFSRYSMVRPTAVWNPYDGSWREMRRRPATQPPPTDWPLPGPYHHPIDAHAELVRREEELYQDFRAGRITDEIYKTRLLEPVREYT